MIQERVSAKVKIDRPCLGAGRPPVLSLEVENTINNCFRTRDLYAYPCSKQELLELVGSHVKVLIKEEVLKGGKLSED